MRMIRPATNEVAHARHCVGPVRAGFVRERSGFTLLEVLLALGLSVVLLVAIAAAIDLYRRMTIAGQDQVSEARLVRAVLRKMEIDIRSIVPPQTQVTSPYDSGSSSSGGSTSSTGSTSGTSGSTSGGSTASGSASTGSSSSSASSSASGSSSTSSSGTTSTSQSTALMDPLQNVYAQTVFGLYGDQRTLVLNTLCVHRPSASPTDPGVAQPMSAIHGDLKTVAYFVSEGQASAQTPAGAPSSGLARLEGDHVAIGYATLQSSSSMLAGARFIAPEVATIGFRYFDGTQWVNAWDAHYAQALPQAIEITLTVRTPDATGSPAVPEVGTAPATRQYRHVVPVSTSAQPMSINELITIPTGTSP